MKSKENSEVILPRNQLYLYGYDYYFNLFLNLYKKNKLPSAILLNGQKGIGKATFAYHFINFLLSNDLITSGREKTNAWNLVVATILNILLNFYVFELSYNFQKKQQNFFRCLCLLFHLTFQIVPWHHHSSLDHAELQM